MRVTVNRVLLDIVIKDKKGQQLRDLKPDELEVYEDGKLQKLDSVRFVGAGDWAADLAPAVKDKPRTANGTVASGAALQPALRQLSLTTLVFDRLSPTARQSARQAGERFLDQLGSSDLVSVIVIDRKLQVLTPFLRDRERLRGAILAATTGVSTHFAGVPADVEDAAARSDLVFETAASAPNSQEGASAVSSLPFAEAAANRAITNLARTAARSEGFIQGTVTVDALKQVVRAQKELPGRKAVVLFAEDLKLPLGVVERFRDLVSAANRAQITFYSVHATGLQQSGQLDLTNRELNRVMNVGRRQQRKRAGAVTQDEVYLSDNANEAIRLSPQENLSALATATGGVLVANTNDLGAGMTLITDDFRAHYELSYSPDNRNYDGSFRKIEVRVRRPGATVRAREGYFALPEDGLAESPFELPLLAALSAATPPRDLSFRAASFVFPSLKTESEVLLYLELPMSGLSFPIDQATGRYLAGVSVLVAVKNDRQDILEKFSQEIPLDGDAATVTRARSGHFRFYRTSFLPAGRYTVEWAVYDSKARKSSVKRSVVVIPTNSGDLNVGSLVLVKRLDESSGSMTASPLRFGAQMVVPAVNATFELQEWADLAFYFVATSSGTEEVTADLILTREGRGIGRMGERRLPAPDGQGQIKYMTTLSLADLASGTYEARVILRQGLRESSTKTVFSLQ